MPAELLKCHNASRDSPDEQFGASIAVINLPSVLDRKREEGPTGAGALR